MGGGKSEQEVEGRPWLLERVDDAAVVQLYADGFPKLPREQRVLVWHLCQAAIAGRDIYLDQRYRHNLALRDLLEETLVALRAVGPRWADAAGALAAGELAPLVGLACWRWHRGCPCRGRGTY